MESKTDYAAINRMAQTKGWEEIEKVLIKDEIFFTKLLKTRKPTGTGARGEFLTGLHDIGHVRGALEIIDKILRIVKKAIRDSQTG